VVKFFTRGGSIWDIRDPGRPTALRPLMAAQHAFQATGEQKQKDSAIA